MSKPLTIQYTGKYANHLLREKDKEIERLNKARKTDIEYNKYLQKEIIRLNNIIEEALRKLRATKDHYKIEDINNAIIYTIRILEKREFGKKR